MSDDAVDRLSEPGLVIDDRYEVVREIGRGAMGTVFEVRDREVADGENLALKVLRTEHVTDESAMERFRREAMVLLDLKHPAIVRIHQCGVIEGGLRYFTMELVRGETLRERLKRVERMDPAELSPVVRDLSAAIAWAHENGVIHRDIKPQNIVFTGADPGAGAPSAKLLDFGIAKVSWDAPMTAAGVSLGTIRYAPPEQLKGARDVDERADVYSLAMVLYEAIAGLGVHPFDADAELLMAILTGERIPLKKRRPDVPPALSTVLARSIAVDRTERPATITELADAFKVSVSD